ncbi:unnamed protein product [Haemonchus placei]|uniref:Resolvase/invertase-type recombinase catalytic domain-containing protein n=1 Tax=Haemonchus placei TaxID=6290 RepID=A0A0N4WQF8_HAEPC|nr:unnamed protein product [Haemonchus placei]
MFNILSIAKSHLENGGKIVTALSPLTAKKEKGWRIMMSFWKMLGERLVKMGREGQVVTTLNSQIVDGKIYIEAGSPVASANFHNLYLGVRAAMILNQSVRERAQGIKLSEIERSSRKTTTRCGGMWNSEAKRKAPSQRRADTSLHNNSPAATTTVQPPPAKVQQPSPAITSEPPPATAGAAVKHTAQAHRRY